MAKTTKKKRASGSTPFVLVRSTTGRAFTRCGIRFEPDREEPVNLDKLGEKDRARLIATPQLAIVYVSAEEYEQAMTEQSNREEAELDELDVESLRSECEALRNENAALRSEIAILTGRRSDPTGGPKENDDKPKTQPLIG